MRFTRLQGAFAALFVTALSALPAAADTINVGGTLRSYLLVTPTGKSGRVPLVLVLHGMAGSGHQVAFNTGWDRLAREQGFAAVFPDAENGSWQVSRQGTSNPDVAFLNKLVATLVANGTAEPHRIYVTGISRGGVMADAMVCEKSQLFAAAAPVISGASPGFGQACKPYKPMPMLFINGTADPIFPFNGGLGSGPTASITLMSNGDYVNAWRKINGCDNGDAGEMKLPDVTTTDKSTVTLIGSKCAAGHEVWLLKVVGGGHHEPSLPPSPESRQPNPANGPENHDIDGPRMIWSFFSPYAQ